MPTPFASEPASEPASEREASDWLIDGYNVLHVVLLGGEDRSGWWREESRQRLIDRARHLPAERGQAWVVFDGDSPAANPDGEETRPIVVFAPSADDWIHRRVRRATGPSPIVVTADRRLLRRCRKAGARIVSPSDFIAACPLPATDADPGAGPVASSTEGSASTADER